VVSALLSSAQSGTKAKDDCLSQSDVEKILGQQAVLTESAVEEKDSAFKQRCTYTANKADIKTNNLAHLYYLFEKYDNERLARNVYEGILTGNQNMPNLQKIYNLGDEALRHTDFENFDMIIIRKGNKLIRLKINKITSMTSTSELQIIAKKITESL
jgi:hypothetical protein